MQERSLFQSLICFLIAGACMPGCDVPSSETQEIIDNLMQAGFPADDIMTTNGLVYVGRDAQVSLASSREMRAESSSTKEQYRTMNLISRNIRTVCVDPRPCANLSSKFSTAINNAAANFGSPSLSFIVETKFDSNFSNCYVRITCQLSNGPAGGE